MRSHCELLDPWHTQFFPLTESGYPGEATKRTSESLCLSRVAPLCPGQRQRQKPPRGVSCAAGSGTRLPISWNGIGVVCHPRMRVTYNITCPSNTTSPTHILFSPPHICKHSEARMDESDEVCPKQINCTSRPGKESFDIGLLPTYLSLSSSSLSCLGSLLILLAYVVLKDMRTGAQKVITLLAIADFFTAFGYIIGGVNYKRHFGLTDAASCKRFNTICEIQSFITTWSSMCSFWWTSILAFYFFLVLVFNRSSLAAKLVPVYNVLAWLGPLTIVLPLLMTDNLGYAPYVASNWCYIKDKDYATQSLGHSRKVTALLFVGGKLWEIMTYVWISVLYIMIRIKVSSQVSELNYI